MITRLKIDGFKNLENVDIRFGAFTCIAGPNASGKSNLFDAIRFLNRLATVTLVEAGLSVRNEDNKTGDLRSIFRRVGDNYVDKMSFDVELIIPANGYDDLGQGAKATTTFVRYQIEIGYEESHEVRGMGRLVILTENLFHIKRSDAPKHLFFEHSVKEWRNSVLRGRRTTPFIETSEDGAKRVIKISQDGRQGQPRKLIADTLPRTILSNVNASESPTAVLTRKEIQSWKILQLEPSAMRKPDSVITPAGLSSSGEHLPATIWSLSRRRDSSGMPPDVCGYLANRLSELIDDVRELYIDYDDKRELLTLMVREQNGSVCPARSLSDGTLRFIALSTIELDSQAEGVICMEEPENGIHPTRIASMIGLLMDIACDVEEKVGPTNSMRQIIINTHSPVVVNLVPDSSLLLAKTIPSIDAKYGQYKRAIFRWLSNTWRSHATPNIRPITKGEMLSYLNFNLIRFEHRIISTHTKRKWTSVSERQDLQQQTLEL